MARLSQKLQTAISSKKNIPWIFFHKIATKFSYHILQNRALLPETVNIYPTFRCNLKCKMCFEKYAETENELSITDWLKIISRIKKFYPRIHISGGEPFIYKDIIKIIEYIKKQNLYLCITTNGTMLETYAEALVRLRVNRLDISIDGPASVHDRIRGIAGTYAKIVRGIDRLNSLKKHNTPVLKINSLINFENPETMKEVIALAQAYHVSVVQFIFPLHLNVEAIKNHEAFLMRLLNRKVNYWSQASNFVPADTDFEKIQSVLHGLKKVKVQIDVFPAFNAEQFLAYYRKPGDFSLFYRGRCRAMWNTATILPDGNLESCPDYVLGNCLEKDFSELWNCEAMKNLRQLVKNKHFLTVCPACCFFYQ